jgi:epoxyqueuosine reductase
MTSSDIKAHAAVLGFDVCGIAPAAAFEELAGLATWLASGYAGDMTWMARTSERRMDVRHVVPSARSVIVTGTLYNTDYPYSTEQADPSTATISRYAWGADYHDVVGDRLEQLLAWIRSQTSEPFDARVYVDTGPVQERVYAQYAGVGWIGKNTCLINPDLGSWLFLGVLITSLALEPDAPGLDRCGGCQLCLQACPTGALVEPRTLDSRRCISYLTIEKRGPIDDELLEDMGSHVYGCDVCQDVCPWNSRPVVSAAPEWQPRAGFEHRTLAELWRLSDAELGDALRGGPMTRTKVAGMRRNLVVAIGNAGQHISEGLLDDVDELDPRRPSLADPAVAAAVRWARRRARA